MTKFVPGGPQRYRHQRKGLRRMIETRGVFGLLFEPGTGKTAVVLDYASLLALKHPKRVARVLVVCPLVAIDTWVSQTETFASPQVDYWAEALGGSTRQKVEALAARGEHGYGSVRPTRGHKVPHIQRSTAIVSRSTPVADGPRVTDERPLLQIEVMNLEAFSSRRSITKSKTMADLVYDAVQRYGPDLVVVDESHKIKGASANASRLLARIGKTVPRRVILTGTVIPHSPLDVFGQWRFLEPTAFGSLDPRDPSKRRPATYGGFKNRYARLGGYMGREVMGFKNLDELRQVMARNSMAVRKEDALDLPQTTDITIPVHLSPAESKAYASMKSDLAAWLADGSSATATSRLTQMLRLRQITSGHLPDDSGTVQEIGSSKADTIRSLVHDTLSDEKRLVVFGFFTAEIEQIRQRLQSPGTEVVTVTGATSAEERARIRKRFGSDDPQRIVLIAQVKTMSVAVNELVTASHAIYASLSQQLDDYVQSRDRLNRIGQTRPVTYWHVAAPGTVDEVVLDAHRDRTDLEQAVLSHIRGETTHA